MHCLDQPILHVTLLLAAVMCIGQFVPDNSECVPTCVLPLICWWCLRAEIQKLLEPLSSLWNMCSEFTHHLPDWMDGPIVAINAEQVAADCEKW